MNQLLEEQVRAAFATAGIEPLEAPRAIASAVTALLSAAAPCFATIPFAAEPAGFAIALSREAR